MGGLNILLYIVGIILSFLSGILLSSKDDAEKNFGIILVAVAIAITTGNITYLILQMSL